MPILHYGCPKCEHRESQLVDMGAKPEFKCPDCGEVLVRRRNNANPTVLVVEQLDNGAMGRKLERPANAEQLTRDRSKQHTKELRQRLGYRDEVEE